MSMTKPRSVMAWPLIEWPLPRAATVSEGDLEANWIALDMSFELEGLIMARGLEMMIPPKSLKADLLKFVSIVPSMSRSLSDEVMVEEEASGLVVVLLLEETTTSSEGVLDSTTVASFDFGKQRSKKAIIMMVLESSAGTCVFVYGFSGELCSL